MPTPFQTAVLSFLISHGAPGRSVYSFEPLPSCGTDSKSPTCQLERVCGDSGPLCAAPRWSQARKAWVRVESRDTAERRWLRILEAAERTATRLVDCKDVEGNVMEDCEAAGWPRGRGRAREMTLVLMTTAFWESGLREDIQAGLPPSGRGPDGEVCLMQVMPEHVPTMASWLPKKERQRAWNRDDLEQLAQTLLGDSPEALDRCFEIGARHLARSRRACSGKGDWAYGMWASYGTGNRCTSYGVAGDFAAKRLRTFRALEAAVRGDAAPKKTKSPLIETPGPIPVASFDRQ